MLRCTRREYTQQGGPANVIIVTLGGVASHRPVAGAPRD
jgi:hypothetical protein